MKKILILISILTSFAFSSEGLEIKEFEFCETYHEGDEKKENYVNRDNTKEEVYLKKKYKTIKNTEDLDELSKYVVFSYGEGSNDYFVFVDPECKYCRAFAKGSMEHLNNGTYHVILFPLPKHKEANKMISFILEGYNNESKYERFKSVLVTETFYSKNFKNPKKSALKYIENVLSFAEERKIKSTPTFFKIDKKNIDRISWKKFNKYIDQEAYLSW